MPTQNKEAPKDKYYFVYISFYLMGFGVLMPWKFFINMKDYWYYKFRELEPIGNTTNLQLYSTFAYQDENGMMLPTDHVPDMKGHALTPLQLYWNSYLSIANAIPTAIVLTLNALIGHKLPLRPRIIGSMLGIVALLVVSDIMTKVDTDRFQSDFLKMTIATVAFLATLKGILQGGFMGMAGQFPTAYMGSIFQGQSMGELTTTVVYIVILAILGGDQQMQKTSAFCCFLIASIYITGNCVLFFFMTRSKFYTHFIRAGNTQAEPQNNVVDDGLVNVESSQNFYEDIEGDENETETEKVTQKLNCSKEPNYNAGSTQLVEHDSFTIDTKNSENYSHTTDDDEETENDNFFGPSNVNDNDSNHLLPTIFQPNTIDIEDTTHRSELITTNESVLFDSDLNLEQTALLPNQESTNETSTLNILKTIWVWCASVFLTFGVCLSVFPSITALVISTERGHGNAWNDTYFTPVGCFLLFHMGDYFGRWFAAKLKWPQSTKAGSYIVLAFSIARFGLIPMFLFCNASPLNRTVTYVYFQSDTVFLILMIILSVSTGYIGAISLMFGPKMLNNPKDQGRAASIIVLFLAAGLTVGALLSAPLIKLL